MIVLCDFTILNSFYPYLGLYLQPARRLPAPVAGVAGGVAARGGGLGLRRLGGRGGQRGRGGGRGQVDHAPWAVAAGAPPVVAAPAWA